MDVALGGAHLPGIVFLSPVNRREAELHTARKADSECLRRELQWQAPTFSVWAKGGLICWSSHILNEIEKVEAFKPFTLRLWMRARSNGVGTGLNRSLCMKTSTLLTIFVLLPAADAGPIDANLSHCDGGFSDRIVETFSSSADATTPQLQLAERHGGSGPARKNTAKDPGPRARTPRKISLSATTGRRLQGGRAGLAVETCELAHIATTSAKRKVRTALCGVRLDGASLVTWLALL